VIRSSASSEDASSLLAEAAELEGNYRWEEAAGIFERILHVMPLDKAKRSAIFLRLALCHESSAFQKDSAPDFRGEMEEAIAVYGEMEEMAERDSPWRCRASAGRLHLESMLAKDGEARRRLLDDAIDFERRVIKEFERLGPSSELLEAGNFGLLILLKRFYLNEELNDILKEGLALAERLAKSHVQDADISARACTDVLWAHMTWSAMDHFEDWYRDPTRLDAILQGALALEPEIKDKRVLTVLLEGVLYNKGLVKGLEVTPDEIDRLRATAGVTRDRQVVGRALGLALHFTRWRLVAERDMEPAQKLFQEIITLFKETKENLGQFPDTISHYVLGSAYGDFVQGHYVYADFATDPTQRKRLLEEAVTAFREGLPIARVTGGTVLGFLEYAGAEALRQLARIEDDERRKLEILSEAIIIAEESNVIHAVAPTLLWNIGVGYVSEGYLRYDLVQLTQEPAKRRELLEAAITRFRVGFDKIRSIPSHLSLGMLLRLGDFYLRFVGALGSLFEETADSKLLDEQILASNSAVEAYSSAKRPARVAEAIWRRARIRSKKGEHTDAAQDYGQSAEHFQNAASSMPSLAGLYLDLEKYLQAWTKIEEARAAHAGGQYREASETYRRASSILKDTQRWSPLSEHYDACALFEGAEAVSHEENPELAAKAFAEAASGFAASKQVISEWQTIGEEEVREREHWGHVTAARERYCRARAILEEAKHLDRKGEHDLSSKRFASATAILESLSKEEETTEGKQEMHTLALFSQAWGLMKEAEARRRAETYEEAAQMFEKVAETVTDEKLTAICRGNAAFCRALRSGTRLRMSREKALYRETKEYLEAAVDSYIDAGMERAANWTRATEYMFDGLVYFTQAEGKLEAQAKRRFYSLAESSFQEAKRLYAGSGYSGKEEEANRRLEQAREKRRVFTSPADALDSSVVLQVAQAQVAPSLMRDQSMGIEQFEASNVQSNLVIDRSEIALNENSRLRIELVNAGRAPAVLVKVSELVPSKFGIDVMGERYRVDEGGINLKGLRLNPFDTADIGVLLKANSAGEFSFQPRIHYLDEQGRYRQHQPQPVTIVVRDVGREVKGEVMETPESKFEFKSTRAEAAFTYLVDEFIEDYMRRRLYVEQAGWRTLTDVAKRAKIPISSLYGRRGGYGEVISELVSRGLVEARIFKGQRGRGGEVVKVRISYDKEPVKRHVERLIKRPI